MDQQIFVYVDLDVSIHPESAVARIRPCRPAASTNTTISPPSGSAHALGILRYSVFAFPLLPFPKIELLWLKEDLFGQVNRLAKDCTYATCYERKMLNLNGICLVPNLHA